VLLPLLRLGYNVVSTVGIICFVFGFILHYALFVLRQCVVARIRSSQSLIDMTRTLEIKTTPSSVQGV
jgi:hypothetical protein